MRRAAVFLIAMLFALMIARNGAPIEAQDSPFLQPNFEAQVTNAKEWALEMVKFNKAMDEYNAEVNKIHGLSSLNTEAILRPLKKATDALSNVQKILRDFDNGHAYRPPLQEATHNYEVDD